MPAYAQNNEEDGSEGGWIYISISYVKKCHSISYYDMMGRQFIVKMCSNNGDFIPDFLASSQKKRPWTKTKQEDQINKKGEKEEDEK